MDRENRLRKDLSAWEQGSMYRRALKDGLFPSLRQMAATLGVDPGNASKAIVVANLPQEVVNAFSSPLEIRFRFGALLAEAVEKDRVGVISRAKTLAGTKDRRSPAETLAALLLVSARSSDPKTVKREVIGALTFEFAEGLLSDKQLDELRRYVKQLIK
jgi:ParB family transcriptional regulator, chromosome partitioning protein